MAADTRRRSVRWGLILAGAIGLALGIGTAPAYAQKSPALVTADGASDQETSNLDRQRGAFDRFLDAHPEIANEVVGDPGVMRNDGYLRSHPELQAFLDAHPQVKADPRAFLSPREWRVERGRSGFDEFLSDLPPVLGIGCFLLAILWMLRAVLENRRWNRSLKMQEELHTKLIEKFASGQDFTSYLQSDAGRRLLEWAPPMPATGPRGLPNPIGRVLWSLQAGLVVFLVGLGLLALRPGMDASFAPPLMVFGTLGATVGAGFILSALISYRLSKHLGLIGVAGQETDLALRS
ncbi:MAG TPA: hypothetical protein VMO17_18740 [Terriglobia bacterium]|nr:hypothetical protein [Terriglobia bacterium]